MCKLQCSISCSNVICFAKLYVAMGAEMNTKRVGEALAGVALVLVASLAHAQSAGTVSGPVVAATMSMSALDTGRSTAMRTSPEHALKGHHDATHVPAAILTTPIIYPAGQQAATILGAERNGELKGWVLLLMGAFLIATVFQRRYQALSDI
jgi:hypothetical protein